MHRRSRCGQDHASIRAWLWDRLVPLLPKLTVSPINAGAVLYNPPERGSFTLTSIEGLPYDEYRGKRRTKGGVVAEVAVDYAVAPVEGLVTGRWRSHQDVWDRIG